MSYVGLLQSTLAKIEHLDLTECLSYDNNAPFIAGGAYGDIRVGTCNIVARGKVKVAVKSVRLYLQQRPDIAKFIEREIRVWSGLKHSNVLPLLGYSMEEHGFPSFISELMENGTVFQYLDRHSELDVIPMIIGIAEGVGYLHDQGVIHSDLKSVRKDNVLISELGDPLICDFGISRMISISQSLSGWGSNTQSGAVRGSCRWMAPELLSPSDEDSALHSKESDIWAFGMTVYELLTKQRPYHGLKFDLQVITAIIGGRLPDRPELFNSWPSHYRGAWDLCETCWSKEPSTRPRMGHIITSLKDIASNLVLPGSSSLPPSTLAKTASSSNVGRDALSESMPLSRALLAQLATNTQVEFSTPVSDALTSSSPAAAQISADAVERDAGEPTRSLPRISASQISPVPQERPVQAINIPAPSTPAYSAARAFVKAAEMSKPVAAAPEVPYIQKYEFSAQPISREQTRRVVLDALMAISRDSARRR